MGLVRTTWGGHIFDSNTAGSAIEEWSCSLSWQSGPSPDLSGRLTAIAAMFKSFHQQLGTGISARCAIEWFKMNQFDPVTGVQITDPTLMVTWSGGNRGAVADAADRALFLSAKVSIDNGTRNRRSKGGFYLPVFSKVLSANGRYASSITAGVVTEFQSLVGSVQSDTVGLELGVWSRVDGVIRLATRCRVGDIPDYISRRKNQLPETYAVGAV